MSTTTLPVIALTPGECTGIGPEITARILSDDRLRGIAQIVLVGDARVVRLGMRQAGVSFDLAPCESPASAEFRHGAVPIVDLGNVDPEAFPAGVVSAESGRLTGDTLARAIDFAKAGKVDAITFAPLNKRAMFDGGWRFPDEHKMFAHLLGHEGYFSEMNVLGNQWMSRVTGHVSLRRALDEVTGEAIEEAIELAMTMMAKAGIERPRLGICALNPHAGENGLFGTEEIDVIRPAVERARARGFDAQGPFPSDTIYIRAFKGGFDGVLAMYHDQGQIASKLHGFNKGVTITAGLSTVFTTPAHGTAFDIVGEGVATTGAIEAAVALAARLAPRRMAGRAAA